MDALEPRELLLIGALTIGATFGLVGRLSGFCLRSAIIEVLDGRSGRQTVAWLTALAVAVTGSQALALTGTVDLSESVFLGSVVAIPAIALGGLMFGFGMVLTRGCGGRHMVLAAGGNLRSWVVLVVLGLSAYATLRGVFAVMRVWLEGLAPIETQVSGGILSDILAPSLGLDASSLAIALVALAVFGATLGTIAIARRAMRRDVVIGVASGLAVGLLIPAGWYVTGVLGFDEFEPAALHSIMFTAPVGNAIQYLMTFTGSQADFGITVVGGTLAGAFVAAAATGSIKAEGFDTPGHLGRYAFGGLLMGTGGVMALGCTIGAGLSGISTLSVGSVVALASIVAGGAIGHRLKIRLVGGRAPEIVPAE